LAMWLLMPPRMPRIPLRLQTLLDKRMQEHNVSKVFYEMEMPLAAVLEEMEFNGIALDAPLFKKLSSEFKVRLMEIEKQVFAAVGYPSISFHSAAFQSFV